jgi:hypothetical protein
MTRSRPPARAKERPARPAFVDRHERWLAGMLLVLHAVLVIWVARENSVTFDENFHVPAGVRILHAHDFATSYAQPPLPKTFYAAAALAAGARDPDARQAGPGRERFVGYTFMRANADRFQRVYAAARLVALAFSLALALLVWQAARAWHGPRAGLLALGLWAVLPESLAQASVAGVDLPTALTFFGAALAWLEFLRRGSWRSWVSVALWISAAFLTRFSAVQILPALLIVTGVAAWRGGLAHPRVAWVGLALLPLVALLAIDAGYLFQISMKPFLSWSFQSSTFQALQRAVPGLRLPVPDAWIAGVDYLSYLSQAGAKQSFLLGKVRDTHTWIYFPVAIAVKWPLGLLALAGLTKWIRWRDLAHRPLSLEDATMLTFSALVILSCMAANLDYGIRYAFPMMPFVCVWLGSAAAASGASRSRRGVLVTALVTIVALESAWALPYPLTFFNAIAGGPGRGDAIVNDSNVDWGQGLVALRRELDRRGITKVHLAYHGTTDPALYGIDYSIYMGQSLGPESDWLAVSSYFLVGLPARLTTMKGMSDQAVSYDMGPLRTRPPDARPGNCMYLFRIR